MANKRSSEIAEFRETEYHAKEESLERNHDGRKEKLGKSISAYSNTRNERCAKHAELDQINVLGKVQACTVSSDINDVNEACHKIDQNTFMFKFAKFLDEKNGIPKFYATWDVDDIRKHSKLETEDQWTARVGTPVEELQLKHGFRCTNLGLQSDPDDRTSRVFTYSRKQVG
jgi:hypothetical protein